MPLLLVVLCLTSLLISFAPLTYGADTEPSTTKSTTGPLTSESSPAKTPNVRTEPAPQDWQQAGLIEQFRDPSTEVIELTLEDKTIQAFFKEQTGPVRHGGIIFFPSEDTHQDWPLLINPLRTELPFAGWATLTLPMPKPRYAELPKRTLPVLKLIKNKSNSGNSDADKDTPPATPMAEAPSEPNTNDTSSTQEVSQVPDYYPAFNALALNAIQALQQRNIQRIVLAGVGTGATWASAFATQIPEDSNVKLLLIDAQQSLDASAPELLALLPKLKITTIDLYSSAPINPLQKIPTHAELRLQAARRNRMNHYHQSRLPEVALTPSGQPWLVRHTRGMLQTYIIKAEKDKKSLTIEEKPAAEQPPGTPAPAASKPAI